MAMKRFCDACGAEMPVWGFMALNSMSTVGPTTTSAPDKVLIDFCDMYRARGVV